MLAWINARLRPVRQYFSRVYTTPLTELDRDSLPSLASEHTERLESADRSPKKKSIPPNHDAKRKKRAGKPSTFEDFLIEAVERQIVLRRVEDRANKVSVEAAFLLKGIDEQQYRKALAEGLSRGPASGGEIYPRDRAQDIISRV